MNRQNYYNYIHEKLMVLFYRLKNNGRLNLLDLNIHSENFFAELFNIIFKYSLINMNAINQNVESIDLIDSKNKIIIQISSTCNKRKIEKTLSKSSLEKYYKLGYRMKFIFIIDTAKNLIGKNYENPFEISFNSKEDIFDINTIMKEIANMGIDNQKLVYDFVRKELGQEPDIVKVDSNLATIINILAEEDFSDIDSSINHNKFNIDKKIAYNNLETVRDIIYDYKIFYSKIDEKYKEFDKQGKNKSFSVFQTIRREYTKLITNATYTEDQIFLKIMDKLMILIQNSKNYLQIPYEELEMCVGMVVVDAFIRCKIFKNPEGYNYVTA
ncbi:ABC-three component system protein [Clostridium tetani]|uniref:ABC-three component system protein n=1 Tax=Clostridium tetani TaxID=1513 RepID=UPI0029540A1B|nr:ABC-three component system protein [Clostridium tetani]BDR65327.1 hypothetical protein K134307016_22610 [Clostridium tetani]